MDVIAVDNLVKRYGVFEAVSGVSFNVAEGEVFGFLGPNGAGKTTTINVLCTLLKPTAGAVMVNGFDAVRQRDQVRRSIGLVFQEPTLDDYLTAEQNLRFHAYAYDLPRAEREPRIAELFALVELSDRRRDRVRIYSGGMKRRLEIARGLMHRPRVLFLDEPTLGLDPQTRHHIWDYIAQLRRQQSITIFLTTHYMDEAEHCDRIAIIDHGRIVALDTVDALKSRVGGDVVTLVADDTDAAMRELVERHQLSPRLEAGHISFTVTRGDEFLPEFVRGFGQKLRSIEVRRPTLDDVFLKLTGHVIREDEKPDDLARLKQRHRRRSARS